MNPYQAAVIGNPISHSLSPSIFSFLAQQLNRPDLDYRIETVSSEGLETFIHTLKAEPNWLGLNVTSPHKESIVKFLDQWTSEAQHVGAVNVVQKKGDLLFGHNTDIHGIFMTLGKHQCLMTGKNALILGTGGAAKAMAYVLGMQKAKHVDWIHPHEGPTEKLVRSFQQAFPETEFRVLSMLQIKRYILPVIDLCVNATPLGMSGVPQTRYGELAFDYFDSIYRSFWNFFSKATQAFDLIYWPEETPFLKIAQNKGLKSIGGLDMLVEQALQTWRIWMGPTPQLEELSTPLLDYLRHRPIFLTGFMGAGKSTVGTLLAKKLGWQFVDTDFLIEQHTQMSISEIFSKKGEPTFRDIESQIIQKHSACSRTVIALGGGSLSDAKTRKTIEKVGRLIFLTARPETLLERLKLVHHRRPLLAPLFTESGLSHPNHQKERIQALLHSRVQHYQQASLHIETDSLTPEEIAQRIIGQI